jgi:hypothetical protein
MPRADALGRDGAELGLVKRRFDVAAQQALVTEASSRRQRLALNEPLVEPLVGISAEETLATTRVGDEPCEFVGPYLREPSLGDLQVCITPSAYVRETARLAVVL